MSDMRDGMDLDDKTLADMSASDIERAFFPLPNQEQRIRDLVDAFGGPIPFNLAKRRKLWDNRDSSRLALGRLSCSEFTLCGGTARVFYVRTGFLRGHYEVDGDKPHGTISFNHWGGKDGAEKYAIALAAVRGSRLKDSLGSRVRRWIFEMVGDGDV